MILLYCNLLKKSIFKTYKSYGADLKFNFWKWQYSVIPERFMSSGYLVLSKNLSFQEEVRTPA